MLPTRCRKCTMSDQPKRGKRVQIYLPADLLEQWERIPRYERSKIVAEALRQFWGTNVVMNVADRDQNDLSPA